MARAHPASDAVVALATRLADRLPPNDCVSLAEHNESVIAVENLISHLDDGDIALSTDELAALEVLVDACALSDFERDVVRTLRRAGDTTRRELAFTVAHVRDAAQLAAAIAQRLGGAMPERLRLWHWDTLVARAPREAIELVDRLRHAGIELVLVDGHGAPVDPAD